MSKEQMQQNIAIVGMGLRFPGARNCAEYWQRLCDGHDLSTDLRSRWDFVPQLNPSGETIPDRVNSFQGYVLEEYPQPRPYGQLQDVELLRSLDPLFLLPLDVAEQTLACSQHVETQKTGIVLAAIALPTEKTSQLTQKTLGYHKATAICSEHRQLREEMGGFAIPSSSELPHPWNNDAVGRSASLTARAYGLGLGAYTIDAACSSSLIAVQLACAELQAHRADTMLAGGLSRPDSLYTQMGFSALKALSRRGQCRPFDKDGDGLMVGEGCGMVLLKRLPDALRDGDTIYGVIRGVGSSNDLAGSLIAPATEGQLRSLREAYLAAHLRPQDIDWIECHGTGTPTGDKVELNSLLELWRENSWEQTAPERCYLSSVKSMIGHLLTGAGIAGLLRVLLSLQHKQLTAQVNFSEPVLDLSATPFKIPTRLMPWEKRNEYTPRRAAVSGFGFGGINAHLIVEEWDDGDALSAQTSGVTPLTSEPTNISSSATAAIDPTPKQEELLSAPVSNASAPEPIAIVGMACHIGSAANLAAFQRSVLRGETLIEQRPSERWWNIDIPEDESLDLPGAYIDKLEIPQGKFRIPPVDMPELLPQQLLILQVAEQALSDAQLDTKAKRPRASALIGLGLDLNTTNYQLRWWITELAQRWADKLHLTGEKREQWIQTVRDQMHHPLNSTATMGALGSIAASRVAREFHFGGPSYAISSGENSGLEALQAACRYLQRGEIDLALVGAVDLHGDFRHWVHKNLPWGIPHTLDERAQGTAAGEGAVAVVLKRLSEAKRDGDRIYSVIRGFGQACAPDSDSNKAETAYETALQKAYTEAQVNTELVSYIETSGSTLPQQESEELGVLSSALGGGTKPCAWGALSSITGNLGCCSGLASVLKVSLALQTQIIPPLPDYRRAPQDVASSLKATRLHVPTKPSYWFRNRQDGARLAGVSCIGSDGQCFHVVLQEEEDRSEPNTAPLGEDPATLFTIYGTNVQEISAGLEILRDIAEPYAEQALDVHSLAVLRNQWQMRIVGHEQKRLCLAVVAEKGDVLSQKLALAAKHLREKPQCALELHGLYYNPEPLGQGGKVAFVYPGSGSHFLGMGREIATRFPDIVHRQDCENRRLLDQFMVQFCQPYRGEWGEDWHRQSLQTFQADTHKMMFAQVSFGCLMSDIIRSLGIEPQAAIGYSLGESTALFSTRAWPERDVMLERMESSDLFRQKLSHRYLSLRKAWNIPDDEEVHWVCAMVRLNADKVRQGLAQVPRTRLLIINTDDECVIGGTKQAVCDLCEYLQTVPIIIDGVDAVHCDALAPVAEEYRAMHTLPVVPQSDISFYSGNWGKSYEVTSDSVAHSIVSHGVYGIDYPRTIRQAWQDGVRFFIEMGPGSSCTRMIHKILRDVPHCAQSVSIRGRSEIATLVHVLASLQAQGLRPRMLPIGNIAQSGSTQAVSSTKNICISTSLTDIAPHTSAPMAAKRPAISPNKFLSTQSNGKENMSTKVAPNSKNTNHAVVTSQPACSSLTPCCADIAHSTESPRQHCPSVSADDQRSSTSIRELSPAYIPISPLAKMMNLAQQVYSEYVAYLDIAGKQLTALQNMGIGCPGTAMQVAGQLENGSTNADLERHTCLCATQQSSPNEVRWSSDKTPSEVLETPLTYMMSGVRNSTVGGYVRGSKPSLHPETQVAFDREQCLQLAVGKVGDVFGPQFAEIDNYPTRVRLPDEPLMLVDRIIAIEGEPLSMGSGRLITEHDVLPNSWYLDGNRAPVFLSVEAGQADLVLSGWLGIDLQTKGERVYRLLDATVSFHRGLPQPGETVRYDIKIDRFVHQGQTWLFFFHYEATIGSELFLTMYNGCAGFFTHQEIRDNRGLVLTESEKLPRKGKVTPNYSALVPLAPGQYTELQIDALRRGDLEACFGADFAGLPLRDPVRLPDGLLRLIHRIPLCDPFGGRWGLGVVQAEADVHPDDWYLTCHFVDDMVMPGTLMYECCAHALRFLLTRLGWVGENGSLAYEPVPGINAVLKCRGPVLQSTKKVLYQVEIKEIGYSDNTSQEPYVIADALMFADGKIIVGFQDISMRLTGLTRTYLENLWQRRIPASSATENSSSASSLPSFIQHSKVPATGYTCGQAIFEAPKKATLPTEHREVSATGTADRKQEATQAISTSQRGDTPLPAIFDTYHLLQFAVGKPSEAFGPEFTSFDERFIARLPGPPYQFLSRIVAIDHPFLQLAPGGWVEAQYDVPSDAWYFSANKQHSMPFCVLLEIPLQACGWLSAYAGSSRTSPDKLQYRNLGGTATLHREIYPDCGTLTIKVRLTKCSQAGGLIIQSFDFWMGQHGQAIYEGDTTFGFFTPSSLANQVGVRGQTALENTSTPCTWEGQLAIEEPILPTDCPVSAVKGLALPGKALLMCDDAHYQANGGSHGLGYIRGTKKVDNGEWFFKAHFFQDPVIPGSLGLESFLQLLKVAAWKRWPQLARTHRFTCILPHEPHTWIYRGQIIPSNKLVTVEAEITEVRDTAEPVLKARGYVRVDGITIYQMEDFGIQLVRI